MPNNLNIIDKVKTLTVKVILHIDHTEEIGTGVIIYFNNTYYIVTVKHVVFGKQNQYKTNIANIKVVAYNDLTLKVNSIEEYKELVLLKINLCEFNIPTTIYLDKAIYNKEYYLRGYPRVIPNGSSFPFNNIKCDEIDEENQSLSLTITNINGDSSSDDTIEKMQGTSGSGVFFDAHGKLYLVGIVNSLIDKHGTFFTVKALTLVSLLMKDDSILSKYRRIEDIATEMIETCKRIPIDKFIEFKGSENINFNRLHRKNDSIYEEEDVIDKNYIRVSEYVNGNVLINEISDIDINFKEKWKKVLLTILDSFDSKYSKSIDNKAIGQSRINDMTNETKESIKEEFRYLNLDVLLLNKLTSHAIAKWLLDCNVDFIIKD